MSYSAFKEQTMGQMFAEPTSPRVINIGNSPLPLHTGGLGKKRRSRSSKRRTSKKRTSKKRTSKKRTSKKRTLKKITSRRRI